jgi:hypothetical protein
VCIINECTLEASFSVTSGHSFRLLYNRDWVPGKQVVPVSETGRCAVFFISVRVGLCVPDYIARYRAGS